ncbi:MAG: ABC transporter permease [Bacteroidales bacterium]|nr:ABC transporter permease [Candidatus Cacconaster merdequi]
MDFFRDWFRTLLSVLGVCVGIFSIVAVFTLVDSLQSSIRDGFEEFGSDMVFIEKEPLEPDLNEDGIFKWWEYVSRPNVSYDEYRYLRQHSQTIAAASFTTGFGDVTAVDGDWTAVASTPISEGRPFTDKELSRGAPVVIIGNNVSEEMSRHGVNPLGRNIRILGKSFTIIGVFDKRGSNNVSTIDIDNAKLIPLHSARSLTDISVARNRICLSPLPSVSENDFIYETRRLVRQYRRLSPIDKDNFAINRVSFIIDEMGEIFSLVNLLGWIVGTFSLLAGGFGIANIMFVSVHERTPEIGIQKALGAKKGRILLQYLKESVVLSSIGGLAGVSLVRIATAFASKGAVPLHLNLSNAMLGLIVSVMIGAAAGMAPALKAARMSPVTAINHK